MAEKIFIGLAALVGIALLLKFLKANSNGGERTEVEDQTQENLSTKQVNEIIKEKEDVEDEELVAVISAAIAASLGVSIPEIRISTIRRLNQPTSTWSQASRIEQVMKRL